MAVGREHEERPAPGRSWRPVPRATAGGEVELEVEAVCEVEATAGAPGAAHERTGARYEVEPVTFVAPPRRRHLRLVKAEGSAGAPRPRTSAPAGAPPLRAGCDVRLHAVEWSYLYQLRKALWWDERGHAWLAQPLAAWAHARSPGASTERFLGLLDRQRRRRGGGGPAPAATVAAAGWGRRPPLLPAAIRGALRAEVALLEAALVARRDDDHRRATKALHELERSGARSALSATLLAESYEALGRPVHAWQWTVFALCRAPRWPYGVRARQVRDRTERAARG